MPEQWYYVKGNQRHGPISTPAFRDLAASGQIGPLDLVWHDGWAQWAEARSISGLFPATAPSVPPPLPPTPAPTGETRLGPSSIPQLPSWDNARTFQSSQTSAERGTGDWALVLGLFAMLAWIIPLCGFPVTIVGLILGIKAWETRSRLTGVIGASLCGVALLVTAINSMLGVFCAAFGD
jgi:hypothetical protein